MSAHHNSSHGSAHAKPKSGRDRHVPFIDHLQITRDSADGGQARARLGAVGQSGEQGGGAHCVATSDAVGPVTTTPTVTLSTTRTLRVEWGTTISVAGATVNALSQAWVDGQSLRTYRHTPNTGSRKSWAAGDATSRAVRLAMLVLKLGEQPRPLDAEAMHAAAQRLTGYVLMGLPAALAVALSFINPDHMALLFNERMGRLMILAAIVMQTVGFLWIRQVIKIEV